MPIEAIICKGT